MRLRLFLVLIFFAFAGAALLATPQAGQAQDGGEDAACTQLVTETINAVAANCAALGPGQACYGHQTVTSTQFNADADGLDEPGDIVDLAPLQSISGSPVNPATGDWGYALLRVVDGQHGASGQSLLIGVVGDASITRTGEPEDALINLVTVPVLTAGETIVYSAPGFDAEQVGVLGGGTALLVDSISAGGVFARVLVDGVARWVEVASLADFDTASLPFITAESYTPFQAFDFDTELGDPACPNATPSMIFVQAPLGSPAMIEVSGIPMLVEDTVYLRKIDEQRFQLIVAQGSATVYPGGPNEVTLRGAGTLTLDITQPGRWVSLGYVNLEPYLTAERVIGQTVGREYINAQIIVASGQQTQDIIIDRNERFVARTPVPLGYPVMEFIPGGEPLAQPEWTAIEGGCFACTEDTTFTSNAGPDGNPTNTWNQFLLGEPESTNITQVPLGTAAIQGAVSPDGRYIAYTTNRYAAGTWEIEIAAIDGSFQQRVTYHTAQDINPVWSPDGEMLAFETNRSGRWEIWGIVMATGELINLTPDTTGAHYLTPYFHPGRSACAADEAEQSYILAFVQIDTDANGGDSELATQEISLQAGAPSLVGDMVQYTDNDTDDVRPVLATDGRMAWLAEDTFGVNDLYMANIDAFDATTEQLTDFGVNAAGQVFSPEEGYIALYKQTETNQDVYVVNLADGEIEVATTSEFADVAPSWRCSSGTIVYHSTEGADPAFNPLSRSLWEVDNPFVAATGFAVQLTTNATTEELFPIGFPTDEVNSKDQIATTQVR